MHLNHRKSLHPSQILSHLRIRLPASVPWLFPEAYSRRLPCKYKFHICHCPERCPRRLSVFLFRHFFRYCTHQTSLRCCGEAVLQTLHALRLLLKVPQALRSAESLFRISPRTAVLPYPGSLVCSVLLPGSDFFSLSDRSLLREGCPLFLQAHPALR